MTEPDKDIDWLRDRLVVLFEDASTAGEPEHKVCVEYAKILKDLLPGNRSNGVRGNNHPDAATIEQVRLAIQQSSHPVPKSQTEP